MITATGILTSLFFGGIVYIGFGFYQEIKYLRNELIKLRALEIKLSYREKIINLLVSQRNEQQQIKQEIEHNKQEFYKRWKELNK